MLIGRMLIVVQNFALHWRGSVAFCRLNWLLVCFQTLFCFIIVLFTLGSSTIRLFTFENKRFFYRERRRKSKQSKISRQIESFQRLFYSQNQLKYSSKYPSFVSNFIHTIVSLFIFAFHTYGICYIGTFNQVYCPYFEIFH